MAWESTGLTLVGHVLEEDVFSRTGAMLLAKGTLLKYADIYTLLRQNVHQVKAVAPDKLLAGEQMDSVVKQLYNSVEDKELFVRYVKTVKSTKEMFEKVSEHYTPSVNEVTTTFYPLVEQILKQTSVFRALYMLDGSEGYTYRHSINVGVLSSLIAKLMKKNQDDILLMAHAGFLHDIGKMLIPKDILLKPDKLTNVEFETVKLHTVYGYNLISRMAESNSILAECALLHHVRLDGSGYPYHRAGTPLPIESQIISIADVFDAICSDRVYKIRRSPFMAAQYLWEAGCKGLLNIEVITVFVHYIVSLYIGSTAVLNTGEEVEVILVYNDEPVRPLVRSEKGYLDLRSHRSLSIDRMIG